MEKTETAAQANVSIHNKHYSVVGKHGWERMLSQISLLISL
jgi:hypothetical protein